MLLDAQTIEEEIETKSAEATFAGDTSELPAGVRCITIPLADELQTRLVLYFLRIRREDSGVQEWSAGFYLERRYDTEPHDAVHEERPDPDPAEEYCYSWLGDAVLSAVERAAWWLMSNSDAGDKSDATDSAIEAWKDEFNAETVSENIFDDPSDAEVNAAADCPAGVGEEAAVATEPNVASIDGEGIATSAPAGAASVQYQNKKTHLEQIISKTVMEQIRFKAALKQCNEALRTYGDELAELEAAWNKPLPLFDKQPAGTGGASAQAEVETNCTSPPAAVDSWRTKKITDLENLTPKIVEILDGENIRTIGDWVDWPAKHPGVEYTQIKNSAGKLTEKRYDKLVAAMDGVTMATEGETNQ